MAELEIIRLNFCVEESYVRMCGGYWTEDFTGPYCCTSNSTWTGRIPRQQYCVAHHSLIHLLWTSSAMSLRTGVVQAGSWYHSSMARCRMGM